MKRILALLMCLAMVFTASALAESSAYESTTLSLGLANPIVYVNDEVMLDLTNLSLELDLSLSDNNVQLATIGLFAGENQDTMIARLYGQLEGENAYWTADGIESIYGFNLTELAQTLEGDLAGAGLPAAELPEGSVSLAEISALPLRSMLLEMKAGTNTAETSSFDGQARMDAIAAMIEPFVTDTQTDGNTSVHTVEIPEDVIEEALNQALPQLHEQNPSIPATAAELGVSFQVNATVTAVSGEDGAAESLTAEGELTIIQAEQNATIPVAFHYNDDMASFQFSAELANPEDNSETATLTADYAPTEDGCGKFEANLNAPGSAMSLVCQTSSSEEGDGFDFLLTVENEGQAPTTLGMSWQGAPYATREDLPEGGWANGNFYIEATTDGTKYALEGSVWEMDYSCNIDDWALDTSTAMTEEAIGKSGFQMAMQSSLTTIVSNAATVVAEQFPQVAQMLGLTQ